MEKDLNVSHHLSSHYPAVVTFKNHLDTLQMSTMQIVMYLYLFTYEIQRINESKRKIFKNATFGACQQIKGFLRFAATKTQGPWCLEKRLETGSSIKQGCIDGFTSQGSRIGGSTKTLPEKLNQEMDGLEYILYSFLLGMVAYFSGLQ